MKLISVNVGIPRSVRWKGKTVTTGIFKEPVEGRVRAACKENDIAFLNVVPVENVEAMIREGAPSALPTEDASSPNERCPGEDKGK